MRALLILLVFLNLAFAAWALLIDRPVYPPAARDISRLPKLLLTSESLPGSNPATPATPGAGTATPPAHCVTVGPFNDIAASAAASELLKTRGFTPVQRDEPGADLIDYWVYLDLSSEAEAMPASCLPPPRLIRDASRLDCSLNVRAPSGAPGRSRLWR
jgi:hypothetical protein